MEPIIEINWSAFAQAFVLVVSWIAVGMFAIKAAVTYAKKNQERE